MAAPHALQRRRRCAAHTSPALSPAAAPAPLSPPQLEMDDGSGFHPVSHYVERQCTVQGLRSGILYK